MATPNNTLVAVQRYLPAQMAYLLNQGVVFNVANTKFLNFQDEIGQLGTTTTFELPQRATSVGGLVAVPQATEMRSKTLTVTQAVNAAFAFNAREYIYTTEEYMERYGMARVQELGTQIEENVWKNIDGTTTIIDPRNPNFGTIVDPTNGPYRFFGDGVTPISSYQQLSQALANFRDYGASDINTVCVLPSTYIPPIVGSGLNQFVLRRNEDIAYDWELGVFSRCNFLESNLLPTHFSGTAGNTAAVLTLVSTNDPAGNNITQLTFSSSLGNDPNAIFLGDSLQITTPGYNFRKWIGHGVSHQPVQIKAIAPAASVGGAITVDIYPALQSTPGLNQNLSKSLVAGVTFSVLPDHVCGLIMSGDPLYLAMPRMPDEDPFYTVSHTDETTGISIRNYWGSQLGQDNRLFVHDAIWASCLVAENCLKVVFPLN